MWFCKDKREAVKAELPEASPVTEVSKVLGAQWKELTDKEKEPYNKQAVQDKARYACCLPSADGYI